MDASPAPPRASVWVMLRAILWSLAFMGAFIFYIPATSFRAWQSFRWPPDARTTFGLLVLAAGLSLAIACIAQFVRHGSGTPSPVDAPRRLVVRGPYRYVRNPMYIGGVTALLGQLVIAPAWDFFAYIAAWFAAVALFVVLYEEPTLQARFGDSFADYRTHVRRWIPRFGKRYDGR